MNESHLVPKRTVLFSAATTSTNGTSAWVDVTGYQNITFFLKTNGSPGAGTCVLEEVDMTSITAGTTLSPSILSTVTITTDVGNSAQAAFHFAGAFRFVRARIGTSVTSTTLDAVMVAN